jgi:hypothetical protein
MPMHVRSIINHKEMHMQGDIAQALIAVGLVEEVLPPPKQIGPPRTTWSVGYRGGRADYPCITAHCATCKSSPIFSGYDVHLNPAAKFCHCGVQESIPGEIGKQHNKMLRRKPVVEPPTPNSGLALKRLLGVQSDGNTQYEPSDPQS